MRKRSGLTFFLWKKRREQHLWEEKGKEGTKRRRKTADL